MQILCFLTILLFVEVLSQHCHEDVTKNTEHVPCSITPVTKDPKQENTRHVPCSTEPLSHGPERETYMKLMTDAGYDLEANAHLEKIHCRPSTDAWMDNGFVHGYGKVGGKMSRIIAFSPGQILQPHKHDVYELFHVTLGGCHLTLWKEKSVEINKTGNYMEEGVVDDVEMVESVNLKISPGDQMEVKAGVVDKLVAGNNGLVFHELVEAQTYGKRSTWFIDV